ncbi:hypothetical protein MSEN_24420 [Mycolicibacter senuensis]|uniref:Uncharacterized protein n=1 Tax=Mycolicibacter senuensis TaxID=386913 RepID=A0A7I9XL74_9MYCO|nr:hypothetical protein MSEN_24420 [Mycolicibacter senuensis]
MMWPPPIIASAPSITIETGVDTNNTRSAATRRDATPPTKSLIPKLVADANANPWAAGEPITPRPYAPWREA